MPQPSLEDLVKEWRDARQALFDATPSLERYKGVDELRWSTEQIQRLAVAECALMDAARDLG